jgi:hypothetical protein
MKPRIFTYKITFEEVPYWYWGVHKESKHNDGYLGSPVSCAWVWEFYTPRLQILEVFPYTDEGWKEAISVESRLISPDLNNPLCLNESCGAIMSMEVRRRNGKKVVEEMKGIHKEGYFQSEKHREQGRRNGQKAATEKTGAHAPGNASKGGKIGGTRTSQQKWKSLIDGYISHAAAVSRHNRARGWDPNARVRLS